MAHRILDSIESPDNLKLLTNEELSILAHEIREEIVQVTSRNGGHVASSLGAVDIILAVHSLINSPYDKFLFDVGHQSYAHMLVTGRLKEFQTLRQYGGLSGFPKPDKNVHDVHPSGHASDSLSVACGLARARDLRGEDRKIVTLIGDASLSGGMAFEALNDIGQAQTPMVIILNDNEMSISRNVGAMAKHLGSLRVSANYQRNRDTMQDFMESIGPAGKAMVKIGKSAKDSLKQFVVPDTMLFEQLGIVCSPPINGHDMSRLRTEIKRALESSSPVLLHVITKKGAGYPPAEQNPSKFHGVGPYDIETGELSKKSHGVLTYTQAFSATLLKEAEKDNTIVAITAAMIDGTGLRPFVDEYPERSFDVGIAEGHALGMASGLALGGLKPVVAMYSTFLQRAIDQTIINNALPDLDIVLAVDRAGLVGDDGPTHHGIFDIVYLRMIPNLKVLAPADESELASALHTALALKGPVALRYPRGEACGVPLPDNPKLLEVGKSRCVREGNDVSILSFGRMLSYACEAADILEEHSISVRVVDMRWIKPLDIEVIRAASKTSLVVTLEEGVVEGGVGEEVLEVLVKEHLHSNVVNLGIPDTFIEQGSVAHLFQDLGLDGEGIAASILNRLNK